MSSVISDEYGIDADGKPLDFAKMFVELNKIGRRLSSSEQRIVMLSYYEQLAGIRNHEAAGSDPTTLIAMNKSEDPLYFDPYYDKMDLYFSAKVLRFTGMDMEQFMMLDSEYADYIVEKCYKEMKAENEKAGSLATDINNLMNQKP